jgi:hypothetical protein
MTGPDDRDAPDFPARPDVDRDDDLASVAMALFGQHHGIDDLPIPARLREIRPLPAFERTDFGDAGDDN